MIDEFRELFAKLYAVGCEHDNYAYALSDKLNAEIDEAMLKAFRYDLDNLFSRCELVSETEKYALDHMKAHKPARRFSWRKFRRVPNEAATAINNVLQEGKAFFAKGAADQTAQIEWLIRMAQGGDREEPEGEPLGEEPEEPTETPQDAPQGGEEAAGAGTDGTGAEPAETPQDVTQEAETSQKRRKTSRRGEKKPRRRKSRKGEAESAGKPGDGNESAAELWDEADADEDEAPGAAE